MVATQLSCDDTLAATCRCLTEDLSLPITACDCTLESLSDHPVINAFLERRSQSPIGSETIQQLRQLVAFSLHCGRFRAATWHDEQAAIVWLLAAGIHREGSAEDAYNYFEELQKAGRLRPTREDVGRVLDARGPKFEDIIPQIFALRARAEAQPGQILRESLGGKIDVRIVYENGGAGLLTVAVSTKIPPGGLSLPTEWFAVILATFFPGAQLQDLDGVAELGNEPLRSDEQAFCCLIDGR